MGRTAIDIAGIQTAKNLIERDLLTISSGITSAELDKLGITILTGIEHFDIKFQNHGYESVARRYEPGNLNEKILAHMVERKLEVIPHASLIRDNIRNYYATEPVETIGISENGVLNVPIVQKNLELLAKQYSAQVLYNVFFGEDTPAKKNDPYGLFRGIFQCINSDISNGIISPSIGNLQAIDEIKFVPGNGETLDDLKVAAYEAFDEAYNNLDDGLKDAEKLMVAVSRKLAMFITEGAALKFKNAQQLIMQTNNGVSFFGRENLNLVASSILGTGQTMLFYTPGSMEFGTDLTKSGDPSTAFISITLNPTDANELFYQTQLAAGTCLWKFDPTNFCAVGKLVEGQNNDPDTVAWNTPKTLTEYSA